MSSNDATERFYAHIWPHRGMALRVARLLTPDAAEAEDLAQEALMRAFQKIAQLDVTTNPKAWLTRILRNVRIDQTRVRGHAILKEAQCLDTVTVAAKEFAEPLQPDDPEAMLDNFSDQLLIDALHCLPEDIRWTLLLVDVQQMAYDEVSEILDLPTGTVKSRVHRGRQMLRDALTSLPAQTVGPGAGRSNQHAG